MENETMKLVIGFIISFLIVVVTYCFFGIEGLSTLFIIILWVMVIGLVCPKPIEEAFNFLFKIFKT